MKHQLYIFAACFSLFSFVSCKQVQRSTPGELVTNMTIQQPVKTGEPVLVTFNVHNTSSKTLKFCKWHTPFEGFMNSIFDIKNSKGEEARYKGIMAKRVMPPPADAYIDVAPDKTVTATIDLLKAYDLSAPGKYTIEYQSSGISGLEKVNKGSFTITE